MEKKYFSYYLKGYLNEYINCHYLIRYQNYRGGYKSYKLRRALIYLGQKQIDVRNPLILRFLGICDFLLSYIIVFLKFFLTLLSKGKIKKQFYPRNKCLMLGIAPFSTYTKGILQREFGSDVTYMHIPFTPHEIGSSNLNILGSLSFFDLFDSLWASLRLITFLEYKYGKRDILFRAHSSFEYFLTCSFVRHTECNNTFITCDIIDRWAFLISNTKAHKIFIQHGKVQRIRYIKIGTPDVAYYMNEDQKNVHAEYIFKHVPKVNKVMSVFEYSGNDCLLNNRKKNILLVCNTIFIDEERAILKMMADLDFNLYLKPHPLTKTLDDYNEMKTIRQFIYVPKGKYPKVDCVLSYESTLADEYESVGQKVIRYDKLEKLEDLKQELVRVIND